MLIGVPVGAVDLGLPLARVRYWEVRQEEVGVQWIQPFPFTIVYRETPQFVQLWSYSSPPSTSSSLGWVTAPLGSFLEFCCAQFGARACRCRQPLQYVLTGATPVSFLWGHCHEMIRLVTLVRIVSVECPGKPRSVAAVVFQLAGGEVLDQSTGLTNQLPSTGQSLWVDLA
jgi:hypothetical protein